jgi:hypothetical protein
VNCPPAKSQLSRVTPSQHHGPCGADNEQFPTSLPPHAGSSASTDTPMNWPHFIPAPLAGFQYATLRWQRLPRPDKTE